MPKRYWLMKSEPDEFSIDSLQKVGTEPWTGVRNYQARNFMMKDMRVGDGVFFYHSSTAVPGIAGVAKVASEPYPDPTQFNKKSVYYDPARKPEEPRWWLVDIAFDRKLKRVIALDELRSLAGKLGDMVLLQRGSRLSVQPVTAAQWKTILSLE
jgi:predicted RNA-binding protein with PUA-like domain